MYVEYFYVVCEQVKILKSNRIILRRNYFNVSMLILLNSKLIRARQVTQTSDRSELNNFGWLISKEFVPNIKRFLPPSYLSNETIQI